MSGAEPHGGRSGLRGGLVLIWGCGGFLALLGIAVARLTPYALDSLNYTWTAAHYAAFVANIVFMAWSEGYRGFQCSYSPRLAARVHYLYHHATLRQSVLAPFVCMGFADAPRRRRMVAWLLTGAIIVVVLIYRALPQPWRGILDAGVVVGLLWGILATLYWSARFMAEGPSVDPEIVTAAAVPRT